jgi:hypothetical protein
MTNQSETFGATLKANLSLSTGVSIGKDKTVLDYEEVPFLLQDKATKFSPCAEFLYSVFDGNIIMNPEADIWYNTQAAPNIVVTDEGVNQLTIDNIYQSIVDSQIR